MTVIYCANKGNGMNIRINHANFKVAFFNLLLRDKIILLLFLWFMPIGSLIETIYTEQEILLSWTLYPPILVIILLLAIRYLPAKLFRTVKVLPVVAVILFTLDFVRQGETYSQLERVICAANLILAVLASFSVRKLPPLTSIEEN